MRLDTPGGDARNRPASRTPPRHSTPHHSTPHHSTPHHSTPHHSTQGAPDDPPLRRSGRDRHGRRPGHRPRARAAASPATAPRSSSTTSAAASTAPAATSAPAQQVVEEIDGDGRRGGRQRRRRRVDWDGAERLDQLGGRDLRRPRRRRQQRRHPARPDARQHDRGGVGRRHQGPPQGHVRARPGRPRRTGASRSKAGKTVDGRIINTTSVSGIYGNPGQTNYGAAKAGIAAFTIIAALELARYGVTVNAVAPVALTRMTEGLGAGARDRRGARGALAALDRADRHLAGSARVEPGSPAGCSRRPARSWPSPKAGTAARRPIRSTTRPSSGRSSPSCSPRPAATPAWTAKPGGPGPSPSPDLPTTTSTRQTESCHAHRTPMPSGRPVRARRDRAGPRRTPCSTPSASAPAPTSWPSPPRTRNASTNRCSRRSRSCRLRAAARRWPTSARSTRRCSSTASRR